MSQNFTVSFNPGYVEIFNFEKYNYLEWRHWITDNWSFIAYLSVLYVPLIYVGQRIMRNRKPFQVRKCLIIWNIFLALFSFLVFSRMLPELIVETREFGIYSTFCRFEKHNVATSFWGVLFCFSKLLDFGDTLFLVLGKKPIIFLHWYHHISVACYSLFVADSSDPSSRWFAVINSFVHTIMYTYYSLRAQNIRLPTLVSLCITTLQILQMVFGIYLNLVTYYYKEKGFPCDRSFQKIHVALVMYASYLVLFADFFYKAYIGSAKKFRKIKKQ